MPPRMFEHCSSFILIHLNSSEYTFHVKTGCRLEGGPFLSLAVDPETCLSNHVTFSESLLAAPRYAKIAL